MLCGLILNPEYIKHISFGFRTKNNTAKSNNIPE